MLLSVKKGVARRRKRCHEEGEVLQSSTEGAIEHSKVLQSVKGVATPHEGGSSEAQESVKGV